MGVEDEIELPTGPATVAGGYRLDWHRAGSGNESATANTEDRAREMAGDVLRRHSTSVVTVTISKVIYVAEREPIQVTFRPAVGAALHDIINKT